MEKIKLEDLCNPSQGQIKEQPDTVIDYIDISSVDNERKMVSGYQTMTFAESGEPLIFDLPAQPLKLTFTSYTVTAEPAATTSPAETAVAETTTAAETAAAENTTENNEGASN